MIERKGSQYRIRLQEPVQFQRKTFRTKDVGRRGGLQLIIARKKGRRVTSTQALRLSAKDYGMRGLKLYPKTKRGLAESRYIPARYRGKGWWREPTRHSIAAKKGKRR